MGLSIKKPRAKPWWQGEGERDRAGHCGRDPRIGACLEKGAMEKGTCREGLRRKPENDPGRERVREHRKWAQGG